MVDHKPGITGANKELNNYWTRGPGLAKWASSAHPWTTLYGLLKKYMPNDQAKGLASSYYHMVFGRWPGEVRGKNPFGKG